MAFTEIWTSSSSEGCSAIGWSLIVSPITCRISPKRRPLMELRMHPADASIEVASTFASRHITYRGSGSHFSFLPWRARRGTLAIGLSTLKTPLQWVMPTISLSPCLTSVNKKTAHFELSFAKSLGGECTMCMVFCQRKSCLTNERDISLVGFGLLSRKPCATAKAKATRGLVSVCLPQQVKTPVFTLSRSSPVFRQSLKIKTTSTR